MQPPKQGAALLRQMEDLLDRRTQQPGQPHGKAQGGVILVVFDGVDGLAGDAQQPGQVLLPEACRLPQLPDPILHGSQPHAPQQQAEGQQKDHQQQDIQQEALGAVPVPGAPPAHLRSQEVQRILKDEQVYGRGEAARLNVPPGPPHKQGHHHEEPGHPDGVQGEVELHLIHFPKEFHGTASFLNCQIFLTFWL